MDIKEKISKVMKQAVDHCEVMGVNLLVEKGGEELLYCEEGMADRENRRLISRDTIFCLYSQTKPVTAACAMIALEQKLLRRDAHKAQIILSKNGEILTYEEYTKLMDEEESCDENQ